MPKTWFIGGVSGSGKTTLCSRLEAALPEVCRVVKVGSIACGLADAHRLASFDIEHTPAHQLDRLQELLLEPLLQRLRTAADRDVVLLDGHFVLPGIGRRTYRIPWQFFQRLPLAGIVVCEPSADKVLAHAASDQVRLRRSLASSDMEYWLAQERRRARQIARLGKLRITSVSDVKAADITSLARFLTR